MTGFLSLFRLIINDNLLPKNPQKLLKSITMLSNEECHSYYAPNMATMNILLYWLQRDAKLKYSNACTSICCTSHTDRLCVI